MRWRSRSGSSVGPFVGKTLLISDEPPPAQCLFLSTPTSFQQFLQPCNRRITVMASPDHFYNLFSPGWRPPVTSIWPRVVRAACVWRIDTQTAIFISQLYFAERHNAGVDVTSKSGNKDDSEAGARDRSYKNFQLFYHVNLKYFPGSLDYHLAHYALCVGRHLISERTEDPIRWY
jgi:hypothetical protein